VIFLHIFGTRISEITARNQKNIKENMAILAIFRSINCSCPYIYIYGYRSATLNFPKCL